MQGPPPIGFGAKVRNAYICCDAEHNNEGKKPFILAVVWFGDHNFTKCVQGKRKGEMYIMVNWDRRPVLCPRLTKTDKQTNKTSPSLSSMLQSPTFVLPAPTP